MHDSVRYYHVYVGTGPATMAPLASFSSAEDAALLCTALGGADIGGPRRWAVLVNDQSEPAPCVTLVDPQCN